MILTFSRIKVHVSILLFASASRCMLGIKRDTKSYSFRRFSFISFSPSFPLYAPSLFPFQLSFFFSCFFVVSSRKSPNRTKNVFHNHELNNRWKSLHLKNHFKNYTLYSRQSYISLNFRNFYFLFPLNVTLVSETFEILFLQVSKDRNSKVT